MSDLGLVNVFQDDMILQMEDIVKVELERAHKANYQQQEGLRSKTKGIKLRKSLEKFKNKILFQTHYQNKHKEKLSDEIIKNIQEAQVTSRSPTLNSAKLSDSHSSSSEFDNMVPSGYVPDLDDILNFDFHCRRVALENFYLNEQNNAMSNELRLAQDSLTSLRKILNSKLTQIENLSNILNSN